MADLENWYGKLRPAVELSFVQPFMLLVMITWGANLRPPVAV